MSDCWIPTPTITTWSGEFKEKKRTYVNFQKVYTCILGVSKKGYILCRRVLFCNIYRQILDRQNREKTEYKTNINIKNNNGKQPLQLNIENKSNLAFRFSLAIPPAKFTVLF